MRGFYLLMVSALLAASSSAYAEFSPLKPAQANANEGQCVTVEGRAHIFPDQERFGTVVQLGSPNEFHGFIIDGDEHLFSDLRAYEGHVVDISGVIQIYRAVPEIRITQAHQLILAPPPSQPRMQMRC
jgi:DNA/RNA endonuclease YhcR with UshA esterase domain